MKPENKFDFPDGTKEAALNAVADLRKKTVLDRTNFGGSRRWLSDLLFQELVTAMSREEVPPLHSRSDLTEILWTELQKKSPSKSDDTNVIWQKASKKVDDAIRAVAKNLAKNDAGSGEAASTRTQPGHGLASVNFNVGDKRWTLRISGPLHDVNADERSANIRLVPEIVAWPSTVPVPAPTVSEPLPPARTTHGAGATRRKRFARAQTGRRMTRRAAPLVVSLLACVTCTWALLASLNQPKSSDTRLDLSTTDNVHLAYGDLQERGISPVCGCPNDVDPSEWWGISALARNTGLERVGGGSYTKYSLFGAMPTEIHFEPGTFKMSARIFMVKHPFGGEGFDARQIFSGQLPKGYEILQMEDVEEPFISIITKSHLHVDLLGKVPVVAMLPMEASDVFISRQIGMSATAPSRLELTERYQSWPHMFRNRPAADKIQEFPVVDYVGPDVVFWSHDPIDIVTPQKVFHSLLPSQNAVVGVFVTKPPFATRVVVMPLTERERDTEIAIPEPKYTYPQINDDGGFRLKILNPADVTQEYPHIRDFARRHPVMAVEGIPLMPGEMPVEDIDNPGRVGKARIPPDTKTRIEFRYPPLPPPSGLNVFGPLTTFGVSKAAGSVSLGHSRSVSVDQSTVELGNISEVDQDRGILSLPANSNDAIKVNFRGSGEVFMDGRPLPRPFHVSSLTGREIGYLAGGLGSLVLAIVFAARLRRSHA